MKRRLWLGIGIAIILVIIVVVGVLIIWEGRNEFTLTPLSSAPAKTKPLEAYSIERLASRTYEPQPIVFGEPVATASSYAVLPFSFMSDGKKVGGLAHVPMTPLSRKLPVVIQLRGYVDKRIYSPGVGTKHSAEVFAANGFVSLAPDFLGYGPSDTVSDNVFEDRFQTYTTALNLLASVSTISFVDQSRVFLWGHSNGGHIALTVLAVLGANGSTLPTSLWAPVTKPFPYSILYYTDEAADYGKSLRKELAAFEKDYDADQFTFYNYLDRISAPLQLHQGIDDEAVPVRWSDEFASRMQSVGHPVKYYRYPGNDHNLSSSWNTVINRDLEFFRSFLEN